MGKKMEKSRKIVIVTLCVITFIIGVVSVSAKVDTPGSPMSGTMHVERILELRDGEISEVISLEGYKDLQYSWVIYTGAGDGLLELVWVSSEGHQVGGGELSSTDNEFRAESTLVKSNYLKISIKNGSQEGDFIRLILYATK